MIVVGVAGVLDPTILDVLRDQGQRWLAEAREVDGLSDSDAALAFAFTEASASGGGPAAL